MRYLVFVLVAVLLSTHTSAEEVNMSVNAVQFSEIQDKKSKEDLILASIHWLFENENKNIKFNNDNDLMKKLNFRTWTSPDWVKSEAGPGAHSGVVTFNVNADVGYKFMPYFRPVAQPRDLNDNTTCNAKTSITPAMDAIHIEIFNGTNRGDRNPVCVAQVTAIEFKYP